MQSENVVIDLSLRWNKRAKSTHRYEIADVNGKISLTVPIEKPESILNAKYSDIKLSTHGEWWHVHKVTLESAYGRTPFFEHYFPRFEKFFSRETVEEFPFLWQYFLESTNLLARSLSVATRFMAGRNEDNDKLNPMLDYDKGVIHSEVPAYWQIRNDRFGFIQGLSALDILFSLGPEASLFLRKLMNDILIK